MSEGKKRQIELKKSDQEFVPYEATKSVNENKEKTLGFADILNAINNAYGENATSLGKTECNKVISQYLRQEVLTIKGSEDYNILVLHDETRMIKSDADKIYSAVTSFTEKKPLLLILYSGGGQPESAYLIGKLCIEYANNKFVISVPRYAKSAATLICCAANEIHMGSLSELGPIDPQINELPALGLKSSIEHIADLVKIHPSSSEMFAKYLHYSLELVNLGYYERVAESAMQYAERLLDTHKKNLPKSAKEIAYDLVYKYKDHGFVIDKAEAEIIFGEEIIKKNSMEYELGNKLYQSIEFIKNIAGLFKYSMYFIGSLDSDPTFISKKK
jgi:hypothetical protein